MLDKRPPTFRIRTTYSKKLIDRAARMTFGSIKKVSGGNLTGVRLDEVDLASPIITVKDKHNLGYVWTFRNKRYHQNPDALEVGSPFMGSYPIKDSSSGMSPVQGVVYKVEKSYYESWLGELVLGGSVPPILNTIFLTIDFDVSVITALELNCGAWEFFDLDLIIDLDSEGQGIVGEVPVSEKNWDLLKNKSEVGVALDLAFRDIIGIYHKMERILPRDIAKALLPMGAMVQIVVNKSIVGWRNFILERSSCYESMWLKVKLFDHFSKTLPEFFVGCEKVWDVYQTFIAVNGLKEGDVYGYLSKKVTG